MGIPAGDWEMGGNRGHRVYSHQLPLATPQFTVTTYSQILLSSFSTMTAALPGSLTAPHPFKPSTNGL